MAEFNKFNMYSLGAQGATQLTKDKVDQWVDKIIDMDMYKEVKDFIHDNFGDIDGIQWFEYPELKKKVFVRNEPNKVEICMLKNDKQYYGKGWIPLNKDNN